MSKHRPFTPPNRPETTAVATLPPPTEATTESSATVATAPEPLPASLPHPTALTAEERDALLVKHSDQLCLCPVCKGRTYFCTGPCGATGWLRTPAI